MNIRRYKSGEEDTLWQLYHDTTHEINGRDYNPVQCEHWAPGQVDMAKWKERIRIKNPFVAEQDGKIVGFAELEPDGLIDYFYCHHQHQRSGVGRSLYRTIEAEAIRLKLTCLRALVSTTAKDFFLSMGFEIVEQRDNVVCGAVAKNYLMRKQLSD